MALQSSVTCMTLPSQVTVSLAHSFYTITRPIITVERVGGECIVSTIFQLELCSKDETERYLILCGIGKSKFLS